MLTPTIQIGKAAAITVDMNGRVGYDIIYNSIIIVKEFVHENRTHCNVRKRP